MLRYSTAQLFTRLDSGGITTWVFEEIPGIRSEFVFADADGLSIDGAGATIHRSTGRRQSQGFAPLLEQPLRSGAAPARP